MSLKMGWSTSGFDRDKSSQIDRFLCDIAGPSESPRGFRPISSPERREQIRAVIEKEIAKMIAGPSSNIAGWISEMRQHNHSAISDIEFITKILTEYKCDRPFVLHREYLEDLVQVNHEQLIAGRQEKADPTFHRANCAHRGLESLSSRNNISSRNLWPNHNQLEALQREFDVILGLAGVRPTFKMTHNMPDDHGSAPSLNEEMFISIHSDCLKELKDRIRVDCTVYSIIEESEDNLSHYAQLEKLSIAPHTPHIRKPYAGARARAKVSFSDSHLLPQDGIASDVLDRISFAIYGIKRAVNQLQRKQLCCNGIPILRYPYMSDSNPLSGASGFLVEIAVLDISLIQELCTQVDVFKQALRDENNPFVWPSWKFDTVFGYVLTPHNTISVAPSMSRDEATASNKHQTVDREPKFDALRSLCERLHAIPDLVGASPFNGLDRTVPSGLRVHLINITHFIALAVQFISLVIQSYVGKSKGNPGFTFLVNM